MDLRTCRKRARETLEQLAERTGLSKGYLSQLEQGKKWPGPDVIAKLSAAYNGRVTANDFFKATQRLIGS